MRGVSARILSTLALIVKASSLGALFHGDPKAPDMSREANIVRPTTTTKVTKIVRSGEMSA